MIYIVAGLGHYDAVDELSLVQGDIKDEKIICLSGKVDCVLALSGVYQKPKGMNSACC